MNPYKSKFSENDEELERLKREIQVQKEKQIQLDKESKQASLDLIEALKKLLPKMKSENSESEVMGLINELQKDKPDLKSISRRVDNLIRKELGSFG